MKQILILLTIIILTSCGKDDTIVKRDLPIEISIIKEMNKYDTLLSIQTKDKIYYFDKREEYIGVMNKQNDFSSIALFIAFLFIILGFVCAAAAFN